MEHKSNNLFSLQECIRYTKTCTKKTDKQHVNDYNTQKQNNISSSQSKTSLQMIHEEHKKK